MARRKIWHVVPHGDGGWAVKKEGAQRASGLYDAKDEAIEGARNLAKRNEPSQIKIHGTDGKIQTKHTYGADPEKYPG